MRLGAGLKWAGIAALLLATGTATAQGGAGGASGQVGFERTPRLSPQEEVAQADAILARIEHTSAVIRRQLDAARQKRDVVKSLCLSDKLSQVDVAGRSTKDRQTSLQAAVQRGDVDLANHEFTIMTVLRQRVEQLSAEANQCLGEEVAFIGQTQVITEVDPNLPGNEEDNTDLPPFTPIIPLTPIPVPPPPVTTPGT